MAPSTIFISRSTCLQFATIGTEIGRAISWRANSAYGNPDDCIARAIDYIYQLQNDPTISFAKRRELARLKEVLNDWYYGDNLYQTKTTDWDRYFIPFALAANRK